MPTKVRSITILGLIGLLLILIAIIMITTYNNLVDMDEDIHGKYSQIENRLQERSDKINQIVASVSGLQEHAESIYNAITSARQAYQSAQTMEELIAADAAQALAFSNFLVVVEDNPNITATSAYNELIYEISMMESTLSVARRDYNLSVQDYNASVRRFPRLFFANLFGFEKSYEYWKINDGADEVPAIDFND
ncbi:MAG: LemA family protein [Acholeplasmataceae bacterium]